ncbi:inorganic phosphate transporter [Moheibacter lacus]|uniref:Phosphate transporter n=1 Tax=Moheibacter lacus TaxID=2745851 RepID=A0A838ZMZ2_9FLAO|nr:inorganic phosphate transporter [Moheibacter lacus]MBA5628497.1 inorganic phosphate transporter [Moheibacter lacus]
METSFIIFIVVLLFILAISDLIVGVSNDAVNFLNSAIGSKVAPYKVIILTAIAGIILGSLFSSGIMEIARKGIFHPQFFTFDKILIVFLAVMLTDIVLLDIFNTLGLPTSTTVSIVFELLGAALMAGLLITIDQNGVISDAFKFINFESTGSIVSGIFLSIIIAFTAGIVIHYFTRLAFTFQYAKNLNKYGSIYAGLGLTSIVYFLLIKGLKGTTLLSSETKSFIDEHTIILLIALFFINFLISFILQKFWKVNPLRVVVLAGTFSLAMAFAGNDLVNFIGVPITGFLAYENWSASGVAPESLYQDYLASSDVIVPNYMLLIAGIVMALTIWLSAKAKKVTETEVNLGRQDEGEERFRPNEVSRNIVTTSMRIGNFFNLLVPTRFRNRYNVSFEKSKLKKATKTQEFPAFDLVRASSNLIIASILIAWATSLKLPLSTTYVSFMVAMGSSLADKAWGRDSAVYRVAGVMSVIGGWFITAFIAFSVAGIFALILYKGGMIGTIILVLVVLVYIIFSHVSFNKKEKRAKENKNKLLDLDESDMDILMKNQLKTSRIITDIQQAYSQIFTGLKSSDKKKLKEALKTVKDLEDYANKMRNKNIKLIRNLQTEDRKPIEVLIYSPDLVQDLLQSLVQISEDSLSYVKNLHNPPTESFILTAKEMEGKMHLLFDQITQALNEPDTASLKEISEVRNEVRKFINNFLDEQIIDIQKNNLGVKQSVFQTAIFLQSRDIQAVLMRIAKIYFK